MPHPTTARLLVLAFLPALFSCDGDDSLRPPIDHEQVRILHHEAPARAGRSERLECEILDSSWTEWEYRWSVEAGTVEEDSVYGAARIYWVPPAGRGRLWVELHATRGQEVRRERILVDVLQPDPPQAELSGCETPADPRETRTLYASLGNNESFPHHFEWQTELLAPGWPDSGQDLRLDLRGRKGAYPVQVEVGNALYSRTLRDTLTVLDVPPRFLWHWIENIGGEEPDVFHPGDEVTIDGELSEANGDSLSLRLECPGAEILLAELGVPYPDHANDEATHSWQYLIRLPELAGPLTIRLTVEDGIFQDVIQHTLEVE